MEVRATAKYVRVQPRKVRIIADEVRGTNAIHTAGLLRYHTSKGAKALRKVLISAMANAQENHGLSPEQLQIATIFVDEGPRLKRMQARAMGRGNRIIKKTSHITVVVQDVEVAKVVKPHGTKPKPRPTLSGPARGKKTGPKIVGTTPIATPVEASAPVEELAPVVEETPVTETTSTAEEAMTNEAPTEVAAESGEASDDKGAQ